MPLTSLFGRHRDESKGLGTFINWKSVHPIAVHTALNCSWHHDIIIFLLKLLTQFTSSTVCNVICPVCPFLLQMMQADLPHCFHTDNFIFKTYSLSLGQSHHPQGKHHAAHFFLQPLAPTGLLFLWIFLYSLSYKCNLYWKKI